MHGQVPTSQESVGLSVGGFVTPFRCKSVSAVILLNPSNSKNGSAKEDVARVRYCGGQTTFCWFVRRKVLVSALEG